MSLVLPNPQGQPGPNPFPSLGLPFPHLYNEEFILTSGWPIAGMCVHLTTSVPLADITNPSLFITEQKGGLGILLTTALQWCLCLPACHLRIAEHSAPCWPSPLWTSVLCGPGRSSDKSGLVLSSVSVILRGIQLPCPAHCAPFPSSSWGC